MAINAFIALILLSYKHKNTSKKVLMHLQEQSIKIIAENVIQTSDASHLGPISVSSLKYETISSPALVNASSCLAPLFLTRFAIFDIPIT